LADETEKITYEIVIDDSKATASANKIAGSFDKISDSSKTASKSSGDYGQALDKLAPGINSTVQGFGGLLNSFKALALSPVGLILTAVGTAFTVIKAAIEKSEPALDFIENIMTSISTTADTLLNNLDKVGSFFGNILIGNLEGASESFGELTDKISQNNAEAQKYLELSRELEDAQVAFKISTADTENQIKSLIIASKNRNLTFDESQEKIKQAQDLEKGLTDQRVKLAKQEAEIQVANIARERDLIQQQNETFEAFVKRITESGKLGNDAANKVADYYAKVQQAASDSLAFQEKVQNRLDDLALKRQAQLEAETKKMADELKKQQDLNKKFNDEQVKFQIKTEEDAQKEQQKADEEEQKSQDEQTKALIESEQKRNNQEAEDNQKKNAKIKSDNEKQIQIDRLLQQQRLSNLSTVLNQAAGLIDKNSAAYKVLAISQASIDTYRAATAALAPPPIGAGPLFGPLLAGTTIALGLDNVAKIAGFAEGGLSGTRILSGMGKSIFRSNGDNMLATVRTGEVILNERQQAALGGSRTFASIGVPGFATGGIVDSRLDYSMNSALNTQLSNDRTLDAMINKINSTVPVLVVEHVENLMNQRTEIREAATL